MFWDFAKPICFHIFEDPNMGEGAKDSIIGEFGSFGADRGSAAELTTDINNIMFSGRSNCKSRVG